MSQIPIWFERKFEFSFPVELLPNLGARLRGTPARLEDAFRGRSHKILIRKAQEKWRGNSIHHEELMTRNCLEKNFKKSKTLLIFTLRPTLDLASRAPST